MHKKNQVMQTCSTYNVKCIMTVCSTLIGGSLHENFGIFLKLLNQIHIYLFHAINVYMQIYDRWDLKICYYNTSSRLFISSKWTWLQCTYSEVAALDIMLGKILLYVICNSFQFLIKSYVLKKFQVKVLKTISYTI